MKKDKKVVKAHQGMAHVPKENTNAVLKPSPSRTRGPIANRPQRPRIQRETPLIEPAVVQQPIKRRRPPRISDGPLDGGGRGQPLQIRRNPRKEMDTQREINKRMRGNKVVTDNQANIQRRADAEIKRRGGRRALEEEFKNSTYIKTRGRVGKRPKQIDPFKGMSSRERRRAQNAQKSEFDETNRQVRKQMGTQRKPRQPRVAMPYVNPAADNFPIGKPNTPARTVRQIPGFLAEPQIGQLLRRNKGGAVKKKYGIAYKKGGYVSRAEYGSVDNIKKKK